MLYGIADFGATIHMASPKNSTWAPKMGDNPVNPPKISPKKCCFILEHSKNLVFYFGNIVSWQAGSALSEKKPALNSNETHSF